MTTELPWRARIAVGLARVVGTVARRAGRHGSVLGGRVATLLDRRVLHRLAAGRTVVLVTGTNGKTTTTSMIARVLGGGAATNHLGANMPDGITTALLDHPAARVAVMEVDESYLAEVAAATAPRVVVLLNFSRDQLDRVGEVRTVARRVGDAVAAHPGATVVAFADDVLCAGAGLRAARPLWVSADPARWAGSARWTGDAGVCPRCDAAVAHAGARWTCRGCGLTRPPADWVLHDDGPTVTGPDGTSTPLELALPGHANRLNATFALAVGAELGVEPAVAAARLRGLEQVGGRYRTVSRPGGSTRLLLAKNPAGWAQVLDLLADGPPRPVVVAVNSREADGRDVSWLWDVPFERLAGHPLVVAGERAADVSVRLAYAGVAHRVADDAVAATRDVVGPVDLVGNYTAFHDAARGLS
ncbi:MurT ligase domain-containing protein [Actinomycetospora atypica]|uniref:Lipid II isoglutaminyl synthase (glutamine-hydrolyzing) subunit MurT n=1 Tax=Actinomycetospora atypica TaxID=1290095 RepID=A0ABV9YIA4_9PSEU